MLSYDKGFQRDSKGRRFDSKLYESWKKKEFLLESDFGYKLCCELIEPEDDASTDKMKKIAILCHGLGCARYGSIKYAELFRKFGFTVLMYDHRNHGRSGKAYTTM
jgi:pimeloyl-ACP methyl ester carboxylesterase